MKTQSSMPPALNRDEMNCGNATCTCSVCECGTNCPKDNCTCGCTCCK